MLQEEKDGNEGPPDEETGRKTKRQSRRRRKGKDGDGDQEEEEKPADHANGLVPPTTDEDELTAEFAWQQKVFSRQEVTRYAHADESATTLERKYREQVRVLSSPLPLPRPHLRSLGPPGKEWSERFVSRAAAWQLVAPHRWGIRLGVWTRHAQPAQPTPSRAGDRIGERSECGLLDRGCR
jgi:hypothetical protein